MAYPVGKSSRFKEKAEKKLFHKHNKINYETFWLSGWYIWFYHFMKQIFG